MTLEEENARLREQVREMTARALGHAYAAAMAEGGEDIQHQELAYERERHGETLATLRKYEGALMSIARNTCCSPCQEARLVAEAALSEGKAE